MTVMPDTNAITALRLGNECVLFFFDHADMVFLSAVVLGELRYGYRNGSKEQENLVFLNAFISKPLVQVVDIGAETAAFYADIRYKLRQLGKHIPTNDLWIASQALEKGAVLLSNDLHLDVITGLRLERY